MMGCGRKARRHEARRHEGRQRSQFTPFVPACLRAFVPLALIALTSIARAAEGPTTAPASEPSTAPAVSEFASAEFRFRLKYPAGWVLPEHPVNGEVFSLRTPVVSASDKRFGVVGLRIDNGPEGRTDVATMMELSSSIAGYVFKNGAQHVIVKPDALSDGTLPGRRIRFWTVQPEGKVATMYVVAVHKRVEYVFNIAAPAEQFEAMLPQVEALLKSFEVLD